MAALGLLLRAGAKALAKKAPKKVSAMSDKASKAEKMRPRAPQKKEGIVTLPKKGKKGSVAAARDKANKYRNEEMNLRGDESASYTKATKRSALISDVQAQRAAARAKPQMSQGYQLRAKLRAELAKLRKQGDSPEIQRQISQLQQRIQDSYGKK